MGKGSLKVRAYTSQALVPLQDVLVYVSDEKGNLIGANLTNEYGESPTYDIDAPNKDISTDPNATLQPFTLVNILAYRAGYYIYRILNAQIFDGILSIENLQMLPLPINNAEVNPNIVVDIISQPLQPSNSPAQSVPSSFVFPLRKKGE